MTSKADFSVIRLSREHDQQIKIRSFIFISGCRPYTERAETVKIKDGQTTTDRKYIN